MSVEDNKILSLEKWIGRDLGDETVTNLRRNHYINYGKLEDLWNYIFEHVYEPKSVQLVKLNLSLEDQTTAHTDGNSESIKLKNEHYELCKTIDKLTAQSNEQENEIDKIIQEINELENSKQNNIKITNKSLDNIVMNTYLSQSSDIIGNFDDAFRKLTVIIDSVMNEKIDGVYDYNSLSIPFYKTKPVEFLYFEDKIRLENVETDLAKLQEQIQLKLNGTESKVNLNLEFSNNDTTELLSKIVTNEITQLNNLMETQSLKSKIELAKYEIDDCDTQTNTYRTLEELLNLQKLEFIEKKCEIKQFKKQREDCFKRIHEVKSQINELFKGRGDVQDIKIFLQIYSTHRRIKANHEFLRQQMTETKIEKETYEYEKTKLDVKLDKLKQLSIKSNKSQDLINNLQSSNAKLIEKTKELQNEMNTSFNCVIEQLNTINSIGCSLNGFIDSNFEKLKEAIQDYYESEVVADDRTSDLDVAFEQIENYSEYKTKAYLINEFFKMIEYIRDTQHHKDTSHVMANCMHLEQVLGKCMEKEQHDLHKYVQLINDCLVECTKRKDNMSQYAKAIDDWWLQPAIQKCQLNKFTVNGKTYSYYYNKIREIMFRKIKDPLILDKFIEK